MTPVAKTPAIWGRTWAAFLPVPMPMPSAAARAARNVRSLSSEGQLTHTAWSRARRYWSQADSVFPIRVWPTTSQMAPSSRA